MITTYSENETKKHLIAGASTIAIIVALFLFLYLVKYKFPDPPPILEEMGMEVNLGNSDNGIGDEQPLSAEAESATAGGDLAQAGGGGDTDPQNLETNDNDPDSAPVKTNDKNKTKSNIKSKPTDKASKNPQPSAEELEQQKQAKIAAANKAKADAVKNKLRNALNKSNSSTSEGTGTGTGDMGAPDGDPNASNHIGDHSYGPGTQGTGWSIKGLKGRTPRSKSIPKENSQETGKVAIQITVDKNGKVIKAVYVEKGSTTSNTTLKAAAIKAAQSWVFNEKSADENETGTIIFNFRNR